ncbi:MAG: hypothetical protein ACIARR_01650 [Phycisphaerales bacterium JB059]
MTGRAAMFGPALALAGMLCGCASLDPLAGQHEPASQHEPRVQRRAAPEYAVIAASFNERVAPADTLWARASIRVDGRDAEGGRLNEQAEGHLQIERPRRLALSIGKLGETHLYLGSSDEVYWWMDLIDKDDAFAVFGRHEFVTPEKASQLGVPVHPLDLIDAIALSPLPAEAPGAWAAWTDDGTELVVRAPGRWGARRMWLDPETLEPRRVEIEDDAGRLLLSADLSRYDYVRKSGDATIRLRLATRYEIKTAGLDATVRINLFEPKIRSIRPIAFDLPRLLETYRIDQAWDLDAPRAGLAGD